MADLTPAQKRKFIKLVKGLNDLLAEVRKDIPEANYYLQEDELHLMSGPSHDNRGFKDIARPDRSLLSETLFYSGGGGW